MFGQSGLIHHSVMLLTVVLFIMCSHYLDTLEYYFCTHVITIITRSSANEGVTCECPYHISYISISLHYNHRTQPQPRHINITKILWLNTRLIPNPFASTVIYAVTRRFYILFTSLLKRNY